MFGISKIYTLFNHIWCVCFLSFAFFHNSPFPFLFTFLKNTDNAFIIFQSIIFLRNSTHSKHLYLCQSRYSFRKRKKKEHWMIMSLYMYILFTCYCDKKNVSCCLSNNFSQSQSPDEGLIKPKCFNADFTIIKKFITFGIPFLFSSYSLIYFHDLLFYI